MVLFELVTPICVLSPFGADPPRIIVCVPGAVCYRKENTYRIAGCGDKM